MLKEEMKLEKVKIKSLYFREVDTGQGKSKIQPGKTAMVELNDRVKELICNKVVELCEEKETAKKNKEESEKMYEDDK